MKRLVLGNVEIFPVSDFDIPVGMKLAQIWPDVPADDWAPHKALYPHAFLGEDSWHNHVGCFVVRSAAGVMLVDTGIGARPLGPAGPAGALRAQLESYGLSFDDIATVFLTHLHFDHVGWNLDEDGQPMFKRARYVLSRGEWNARPAQSERAVALGQPPYIDRCVTPLEALGVLDLIDGEHALSPEITAIPTPGHSPGHMSVVIRSAGQKAMILGDVLLHPAQVSEPDWSSRMDMDAEVARMTRRNVIDRLEAEGIVAAAGHIREQPFGRVARRDGRRLWVGYDPVDVA